MGEADRAPATAWIFLAALTVFLWGRQEDYWSDAKFMILWIENGRWLFYHLAYLPLGQIARLTLGRMLAWDAEETLFIVSAASGALAVALFYRACGRAGIHGWTRLLATAVLGTAPVVWFYATAIEVHIVQMAAASGGLLWGVEVWRSRNFVWSGWAPPCILLAMAGTHLTGLVWTPALFFLSWKGVEGGRARVLSCLGVFSVAAILWIVGRRSHTASASIDIATSSLEVPWSARLFLREFVRPAGFIHAGLTLGLLWQILRHPRTLRTIPVGVSLILFASFLPFAFTVDVFERGAYFLSLLPIAVFWIAWWARELPSAPTTIALGATAILQCQAARAEIERWQDVVVPSWLAELDSRTHERAVFITLDRAAAGVVSRHTRMLAFAPRPRSSVDLSDPGLFEKALRFVAARSRRGASIILTTDVIRSTYPPLQHFREGLNDRLGTPTTDPEGRYVLYLPHEGG